MDDNTDAAWRVEELRRGAREYATIAARRDVDPETRRWAKDRSSGALREAEAILRGDMRP